MPLLDQDPESDHDSGNIANQVIQAVDIVAADDHGNQIEQDGHAQQGQNQVEYQNPGPADEGGRDEFQNGAHGDRPYNWRKARNPGQGLNPLAERNYQ